MKLVTMVKERRWEVEPDTIRKVLKVEHLIVYGVRDLRLEVKVETEIANGVGGGGRRVVKKEERGSCHRTRVDQKNET